VSLLYAMTQFQTRMRITYKADTNYAVTFWGPKCSCEFQLSGPN